MVKNIKMFEHIVDPEMRIKVLKFVINRPLESFLIISFMYMLLNWFSYRSLSYSYFMLIIFNFIRQYDFYICDIIGRCFDFIVRNFMIERNKMVMAHFMKPGDIVDEMGNDAEGDETDSEVVRGRLSSDEEKATVLLADVEEVVEEENSEDNEEGIEGDEVGIEGDDETVAGGECGDAYLNLRKRQIRR